MSEKVLKYKKEKRKYIVIIASLICLMFFITFFFIKKSEPQISSYFYYFFSCYIATIYFLMKSDIDIKKFFNLTENQYWHYNWIYELYDLGVFKNKKEYDLWMRGFEDRYSKDLHEAMNLVFKIRS